MSERKIAFFEPVGGASGNMVLGALLDAGLDQDALESALRTIPVGEWQSERRTVVKAGIAATYFDFVIPGETHTVHDATPDDHHGTRRLGDVLALLDESGLTALQKERARATFVRLGEAEAKVHGTTVDSIHFHEVGQIDAILDVAGACVALDLLRIERIYCAPLPVGRGEIHMHHGRYPNPPPATAELLRGFPTYGADVNGEMVTTTGAAILSTLVYEPGTRPAFSAGRIGYGAGRSDFAVPNVLRVSLGELSAAELETGSGEVVVLEANIDDMQPQHFELALERILAAGAYDVWLAPITMKKARPAVLLGAIAPPGLERAVAEAMLSETTTLGVRTRRERRYTLARHTTEVATEFGPVRVKIAYVDGGVRRTLEYDDVVRIAREENRPIAEIAARLEEMIPRA